MATLSAMPSVSFLHAFLALCNCPQIGTLWPPVRLTANVTHSLWFSCITQLFLNVLSVLLGHWLTENLSIPDYALLRFANLRFFGSWSKYSRRRKTVFKYSICRPPSLVMSNQRFSKIVCFRFPTNVPKKIEYIRFWNKVHFRSKTFSFRSKKFWITW